MYVVLIPVAASPHTSITVSFTHTQVNGAPLPFDRSIKCKKGGTQKLTKATEKQPTNVSILTKPGTPTLIITVTRQIPNRTVIFVR